MTSALSVCLAIRDLCAVIEENTAIFPKLAKPAALLAAGLDARLPLIKWEVPLSASLTSVEAICAVEVAADIADALVKGKQVNGSLALVRLCERVVVPITDAAGYPVDGG